MTKTKADTSKVHATTTKSDKAGTEVLDAKSLNYIDADELQEEQLHQRLGNIKKHPIAEVIIA
ncbi:MAG TPA: hypothetical protein O0X39_01145 [Methanocorpusculum sp.]|nr:hypothetical protein [Methanocorpusculum sp.]